MVGRQLTLVALPYQVFLMTHSSLAVGAVGLAQAVPQILVGLYGGTLADRQDRRRLMLVTRSAGVVTSVVLAAAALTGRAPLAGLYMLAAAVVGVYVLEHATRSATVPRLVPERMLPSALSLVQLLFQAAVVIGPAAAGLVIDRVGLGWAYVGDGLLSLAGLAFLLRLSPLPPALPIPRLDFRAPLVGLGHLGGNRLLLGIFAADLCAMIFALPRALYPALATDVFRVGPAGLGLFYSAPGAGALLAVLFSGWVGQVRRRGLLVIWSVLVWGASIVVFGLAGLLQAGFALALVALALAGAADMISAVFRHTILQLSVSDSLRGRMSALNTMVVGLGPSLGDVRAGAVASLTNPVVSVISGGVLSMVGAALVAVSIPELRRNRAGQPAPDAAAQTVRSSGSG